MKIEGAISVKAAIEANKRAVKQIIIDKDNHNKNFNYIRSLATKNNIPIKEETSKNMSKRTVKNVDYLHFYNYNYKNMSKRTVNFDKKGIL